MSCNAYRDGICIGISEPEQCSCGGDENQCNFYPKEFDEIKTEPTSLRPYLIDRDKLMDLLVEKAKDKRYKLPVWVATAILSMPQERRNHMKNRAYILIDAQNDFMHKDGALTTEGARKIIGTIRLVLMKALDEDAAIYYTQDTHYEDYLNTQEGRKLPIEHCRYGTWGWQIVDGLDIKETRNNRVHHLIKCAFAYDDWESEELDQYDEIIIFGVVSSICVLANAVTIKMLYPELPIKFLAYASAGLNPEDHQAAMQIMRSLQIEVVE